MNNFTKFHVDNAIIFLGMILLYMGRSFWIDLPSLADFVIMRNLKLISAIFTT